MLTVTRTLQGLGGAAVAVVAMAIVRDLFTGIRAAQLLSRLILVLGVAPILAPSLGSALLTVHVLAGHLRGAGRWPPSACGCWPGGRCRRPCRRPAAARGPYAAPSTPTGSCSATAPTW